MLELKLKDHRSKFYEEGEQRQLDVFEIGRYEVKRVAVLVNNKVEDTFYSVDSHEEYAPDIFYEEGYWHDWDEERKPKFMIQTTAYGAKPAEEIEKVIAGYQEAIEVVRILTEKFLK